MPAETRIDAGKGNKTRFRGRRVAPKHHRRLIIQLKRIGHSKDGTRTGASPEWLIVANAPIQHVLIAGLLENVRGDVRGVQIRRQPSGRGSALVAGKGVGCGIKLDKDF